MGFIKYVTLSSLLILSATSRASATDYVTCESKNDRRAFCDIRHARDAEVEVSRQLSSSPCIRGDTWGQDDRGIWVEQGCRAEFSVRRGYDDRDSGYDRHDDYRERDRERDRDRERYRPPPPEQCPQGFEPGNHRCSPDERRRGCKDMKMPGGTTCNSRGWSR